MTKHKHIFVSIFFIVFLIIAINLFENFNNSKFYILHAYAFLTLKLILYFILGLFLDVINRKMHFRNIRFSLFHFTTVLLCAVAIALCLIFYNSLPSIVTKNLDVVYLFLASYAGANSISIVFNE